MNTNQEEAFVRAFIEPDKQERYRQLLANPKRRHKALRSFYHTLETVPGRTTRIHNRDHSPEAVERLLRQKGAGLTCYLISPEADLDQQAVPLREALDALIRRDGVAVACCIPGRLAYYKAELAAYILEHQ